MDEITPTEDNQRHTRSKSSNSTSESCVLDFSQPTTLSSPGRYVLSNSLSGCYLTLFDDVFPAPVCETFLSEIESTGTLKQYTTVHKSSQVQLPRLSSWYGPVDYAFSGIVMKANSVADCPRLTAAYQNIAENLLRPNNIDCSADCFLINKYRTGKDSCGEHSDNEPMKRAIDNAKTSIEKLLSASSAKIVVSLPTPTPGPLNERTDQFVAGITEFVTTKRSLSDYNRRLFTINNTSHFSRALTASNSSEDRPNPLKPDQLHVSEYGMKKLCLNIKFGLYRSFSMKAPRKQASPEP